MAKSSNPLYKVSKQSWTKKGLLIAKRQGHDELKIESIAERLNVTKGSFYHHFKNLQEFEKEIAKLWREESISSIGEADSNNIASSLQKFYGNVNVNEETKFRAWAESNGIVSSYLKELDQARIDFLKELYQAKFNEQEAAAKAFLEYGAFIGIQQLYRYMDEKQIKATTKEFMTKFRH